MRYLLIDRIIELSPPEIARAYKCVTLSDDIFGEHFPGYPVMPGAMILEGLAQTGGVLLEASMREKGRHDLHALLVSVRRAKFKKLVVPGDRIEMVAKGLVVSEDGGQVKAFAYVDEKIVSQAEMTFAFAQVTSPRLIQKRKDILNVWLHGAIEAPTGSFDD